MHFYIYIFNHCNISVVAKKFVCLVVMKWYKGFTAWRQGGRETGGVWIY